MSTRIDNLARRERGAFFTPPEIATTLANWSISSPMDKVIDPGAGDGELLLASVTRLRQLGTHQGAEKVLGIEIDPSSAGSAQTRLRSMGASGTVHHADAFPAGSLLGGNFDAVLTNPPWVRYQLFSGDRRRSALEAACASGVQISGMANYWAPYLVHASSFVAPQGKLAAVVPAELLHADYAQPVRDFLLRRFRTVVIVAFSEAVFKEAEVNALLLLTSNASPGGFHVARVESVADLASLEQRLTAFVTSKPCPGSRWDALAAGPNCLDLLNELRRNASVATLGDFARIGIGVVTGADRFFFMTPKEVALHRISRVNLTPAIGTLKNIPGLEIDRGRWLATGRRGGQTWLFSCRTPSESMRSSASKAYVQLGEAQGYSDRLKCSIRRPWYHIGLPEPSEVFLTYMIDVFPRLVLNTARLQASNRVHRVTLNQDALAPRILATSFLSSLTQLSAEIEGRVYGGGVLKLEPQDARRLSIVVPTGLRREALESIFPTVDSLLRRGRLSAAVGIIDEILLRGELGLSEKTVIQLQEMLAFVRGLRRRKPRHGRHDAVCRLVNASVAD